MGALYRIALRQSRTVEIAYRIACWRHSFVDIRCRGAAIGRLKLHFTHTGERGELHLQAEWANTTRPSLKKLNHILRDWRRDDEATKMDPRLFDIIWEVYREVGAKDYIYIVSGYRSVEDQ